ncbi:MAG TPA: PQQ-dependent sugar dehydrogenase [Vicinamibacterales bacterium]|jgi:glucose/arabinose dehydrogenase
MIASTAVKRWCAAGVATLCTAAAAPLHAATLPQGFSETLVANGLSAPTAMEFAPDGRLFVCEQAGTLRVIKSGTLLPTPFLSVPTTTAGERGLLGIAFDPAFALNGFVYVYYTATTPTVHNRISRFTASGDVAVAGSERILLDLDDLNATNHNGGALNFGPDGKLYAAVGENANGANAQTLTNLLGKMLRLNKDGTIPTDNPFYTTASGRNRAIWALGLRNPFTFAFNAAGTKMFINDVGQSTWEEIDDGAAGANYGWPTTEGPTTVPGFVSPRYAYTHADGSCAITGGAFYNPAVPTFPSSFLNDYFFADFCGGYIKKLDPAAGNTVTTFATGISNPVDLKVSSDGALYYLARGIGAVYRVTSDASGASYRLFFQNSTTGGLMAWDMVGGRRVGTPGVTPSSLGPGPWRIVGSGDFNGDQQPDLVVRNSTSGAIAALIMNGATAVEADPIALSSAAGWEIKAVADMNGDGKPDLIWQQDTGVVGIWYMDGVGVVDQVVLTPRLPDTNSEIAAAGDLNGDGRNDLLIQNGSTGALTAWLMNGSVRTAVRAIVPDVSGAAAWHVRVLTDVNGDGTPDLLWQNEATGQLGAWLMNGTTLASTLVLTPDAVPDPAWQLVAPR